MVDQPAMRGVFLEHSRYLVSGEFLEVIFESGRELLHQLLRQLPRVLRPLVAIGAEEGIDGLLHRETLVGLLDQLGYFRLVNLVVKDRVRIVTKGS